MSELNQPGDIVGCHGGMQVREYGRNESPEEHPCTTQIPSGCQEFDKIYRPKINVMVKLIQKPKEQVNSDHDWKTLKKTSLEGLINTYSPPEKSYGSISSLIKNLNFQADIPVESAGRDRSMKYNVNGHMWTFQFILPQDKKQIDGSPISIASLYMFERHSLAHIRCKRHNAGDADLLLQEPSTCDPFNRFNLQDVNTFRKS
jgi:hypothetical protein